MGMSRKGRSDVPDVPEEFLVSRTSKGNALMHARKAYDADGGRIAIRPDNFEAVKAEFEHWDARRTAWGEEHGVAMNPVAFSAWCNRNAGKLAR